MTARKKSFPRSDTGFDTVQSIIMQKTMPMINQWHLDQQWITEILMPASQRWNIAWEKYKAPMTRTQLIVFEKNEARAQYEPMLRMIIQNFEYNTFITDDELAEMNIYRRSHKRVPAPSPKREPGCKIGSDGHRILRFSAYDIETGKHAKPEGVHNLVFRWAILVDQPKDVDELINSDSYTRNSFTKEFKESERGKTVYFCLRWENSRSEKGPWSDITNTIIP
jgi:hypothetical protein